MVQYKRDEKCERCDARDGTVAPIESIYWLVVCNSCRDEIAAEEYRREPEINTER